MDFAEYPFQISVTEDELVLLQRKLDAVRFPDEIEQAEWAYGAPLADIQRLVERWRTTYDWRLHERALNKMPMFTKDIILDDFGTLNLHYIHQKSTNNNAIPLLFVHGWPGSFIEVQKLLPLLTESNPVYPSFHVVAPSLPGFAWSQPALKKGFQGKHYAELFHKLMLSLGYAEYVTQGGDWGHRLTRTLAYKYGPTHVKASHTNFPIANSITFLRSPIQYIRHLATPYTRLESEGIARFDKFMRVGSGYSEEQSTMPQTLGYSLADSPVGPLSWIYEKLVDWSDAYPWTDDEVLSWVSIYWFSRAGPAASLRIYYELQKSNEVVSLPRPVVPFGISFFPKEINMAPKAAIRGDLNVAFESEHQVGGHFPAYEQPEALASDLRKMFGKNGPVAGVVPGRSGY
ncbi:alpha/beta-hydrolase [Gloeopeniophorella convolvens]|nr:alpha/beta-hydrolase [Gloeopeniophorella convolvens]